MQLELFKGTTLIGGYTLVEIKTASEPMLDALDREAIARTHIHGRRLSISICPGLNTKELSVTMYHEILEAMTVAVDHAPRSVADFNEGDFDRAAYEAYDRFGPATPESLNWMLQSYGFSGE